PSAEARPDCRSALASDRTDYLSKPSGHFTCQQQTASSFCWCYRKMSGGNCHVKRSSPYGDLHVEPKGTASPRAAQGPLCGPGDHTAGCERAGGEPSPDPAAAAAV